jgi:hypothetical protein
MQAIIERADAGKAKKAAERLAAGQKINGSEVSRTIWHYINARFNHRTTQKTASLIDFSRAIFSMSERDLTILPVPNDTPSPLSVGFTSRMPLRTLRGAVRTRVALRPCFANPEPSQPPSTRVARGTDRCNGSYFP